MTVAVRVDPSPSPTMPLFDAATLAAARRGEAWAQRAFVLRFQRPVHALCWRMLGTAASDSVAQDVTQDALVRAVRSLPRFEPAGPARLSTWVFAIAARAAIDELRRRRVVVAELDESAIPSDDRPDLTSERHRLGRAIAEAVDELSPEIRATFVLRAYHELEYPEIALVLEIDLGTVKSRLWRARQALQRRLKEVRHG